MKKTILIGMLALTVEASALGVHSSEITQTCAGSITATKVQSVGVSRGFVDRAGNEHSPSGYAYIDYKFQGLGAGCTDLEQAYDIDLEEMTLSKHHILIGGRKLPGSTGVGSVGIGHSALWPPVMHQISDKDVFKKAKALIGKSHPFELQHNISHQQKDGFLPFYPLVHSESFQLKVEGVGNIDLSVPKENKKLSLKEHKELSNAFFEFIDSEESEGFYTGFILGTLFKQAPLAHHTYLKDFVPEVIEFYKAEELKFDGAKPNYSHSDTFNKTVEFLKKLSAQHNWKSKITQVDFVLKHPSLLYSNLGFFNKTCLNIDAVYLENFVEELEFALFDQQMTEQVFNNWEQPLKDISGSSFPKGCLSKISSKAAKSLAKELLEQHYQ